MLRDSAPVAPRPVVGGAHALTTPSAGPSRARSRALLAGALWLLVLANAGVIIWLWLRGGGVSQVKETPELLTSLGRITGLIGAYLALVQVLLLARLPPLERLAGFDRLTVWHRLNGKVCIVLVIAHVVLITAGYAGMDQLSLPSEFSRLLSSYPGMITATVGTALMIAVVATSLVVARRRLPYEVWYLVHITVYAGIALAYIHQLPTGKEFTTSTSQSDYWISLYVLTLALVLIFRVAVPIWNARRYRLRVAEVTKEAPGVVSLRITGRRLAQMNAHAGQFMLWRFLTPGAWWQAHPFSLSAAPDGRSLRLTVKQVGDFTRTVGGISPGTRVFAEGPFGTFTSVRRTLPKVALIAGGIGITPIRALFEELPAGPGELVLIYRALAEEELVFREELGRIASERGAEVHYVVGDHREPAGRDLLSSEHLARLVPDLPEREVYLCGPAPMMERTRQALGGAGVPDGQVHSERFALAP